MIGKTISHYKILEKLGEGGMGVVYKAEDIKLKRTVALKFLPSLLTADGNAKERFIQEAQAASALDHPNICTIHEINETEDGQLYIIMACYSGQTLKERLAQGPLAIEEAVRIAEQIAEGLAEAHEKGTIHRDIKPANIMITDKGQVKIMDFGLAKLAGQTHLTRTGSTIGTMAYMSPEQVRGEQVDHQTDIWSLGVIIYEMLTGKHPFSGEYEAAIIFSILNEKPKTLPDSLHAVKLNQAIVDRCLVKDKTHRYYSINDMLTDLKNELTLSAPITTALPRHSKKLLRTNASRFFTMLFIVFLLIILLRVLGHVQQPSTTALATHRQLTFTGKAVLPTISPDGQFMAYVSTEDPNEKKVMVQEINSSKPWEVFKAFGIFNLRWSPSGSQLLISHFSTDAMPGITLAPRMGGAVHNYPYAGVFIFWLPDGRFAGANYTSGRIWFAEKSTGDTTSIRYRTQPDHVLRDLDLSPTGKWLALVTNRAQKFSLLTLSMDGKTQNQIIEDSVAISAPRWSTNGDVIYFLRTAGQTSDLNKIQVSQRSGERKGEPTVLQTGIPADYYFTLSRNNKQLLYTRVLSFSNLWQFDNFNHANEMTVKRPLTKGTMTINYPQFSPDGRWLAFISGYPANIFIKSLEKDSTWQLTFLDADILHLAWSPDGREIAFSCPESGAIRIWKVAVAGGPLQTFKNSQTSEIAEVVWAPGSEILYHKPGHRNFYFLNPRSGQIRPLFEKESGSVTYYPRYAPNGKSLALYYWGSKKKSDHFQEGIYLISLTDFSELLLLAGASWEPIEWSPDGLWIYARNRNKKYPEILMVPVNGGTAKSIFTMPFETVPSVCIHPKTQRMICTVAEAQSDVWLMEKFDPEIE